MTYEELKSEIDYYWFKEENEEQRILCGDIISLLLSYSNKPNGFDEKVGKFSLIAEEVGSLIFYFIEHNIYIKLKGYYSSFRNGWVLESWSETFPYEKTITCYK